MKKRVLPILLTGVMLAGLLSGCGGQGEENNKEEESSVIQNNVQQEEIGEDDAEPVTVTWLSTAGTPEEGDEEVFKALSALVEEKIGVRLEWNLIDMSEFTQRAQLMSSSGEDFDLVFTASNIFPFEANVNLDAFMPLNDLLASDAGEMLRESVPEWLLDMAKVSGELYAIPNYQIMAEQICVSIQKEYADKYDLDVDSIKSVWDLEPFLQQIRDNEPDMIPADVANFDYMVREKPADVWGKTFAYFDDDTHTVQTIFDNDKAKENWRKFNEWFHKGYFRSDLVTQPDSSSYNAAQKFVCIFQRYKPGVDVETETKKGFVSISIPITEAGITSVAGRATMNAINANSKNPEAAMKVLGLFYSDPEVYNMFLYGLEGVHYKKLSENRVEVLEDSNYVKKYNNGWAWGNQFNAWLLPSHDDNVWIDTEKMNEETTKSPLLGFSPDTTVLDSKIAQISAVDKEYSTHALIAADNFDEQWDAMENAFKEAGLESYKEEIQRQINEWVEVNK